jgi:hypothetical protein
VPPGSDWQRDGGVTVAQASAQVTSCGRASHFLQAESGILGGATGLLFSLWAPGGFPGHLHRHFGIFPAVHADRRDFAAAL